MAKFNNKIVLIGMPNWAARHPFYALALVKGLMKAEGYEVCLYDINRHFYSIVDESDKQTWEGANNFCWVNKDFCDKIYDKHLSFFQEYMAEIAHIGPCLYGFSVNTWNRNMTVRFAAELKKHSPGIPILFGGVDCFTHEIGDGFLKNFGACCDLVCTGEGEVALRDFLAEFKVTGTIQTRVKGFAWRDHAGNIVDTGEAELPNLKDKTAWADYDDYLANQSNPDVKKWGNWDRISIPEGVPFEMPFLFTKGCIYKCNFCSESRNFKRFRARDMVEAVDEIEHIIQTWCPNIVPHFALMDSNFNANAAMLHTLVNEVKKRKLKFVFGGQAHFEESLTDELLRDLHDIGLIGVSWGLESGSQRVVDLMNKRFRLETARRLIRKCHEIGIASYMNLLAGYPGETARDCIESVCFVLEHRTFAHFTSPNCVAVRLNSPLHDTPGQFNIINADPVSWKTADGLNTYPVRLLRQFLLRQAVYNDALTMETVYGGDIFDSMNTDDQALQSEMKNLAFSLSQAAGLTPENDPLYINLATRNDFGSSEAKSEIMHSFLALLKRVSNTIKGAGL